MTLTHLAHLSARSGEVERNADTRVRWPGGFSGYLELKILSASNLGLTVPTGFDRGSHAVALLGKGPDKVSLMAKAALPVPKLHAYLPTNPPPRQMEVRRTPDLPERTANPVWQCTWHFTIEFSPEDEHPSDIRLEVWNVDGRNEFLGEVVIPFPFEPGFQQYHCPLEANPGKMKDRWKVPSGVISFQTKLKSSRVPQIPRPLKMPGYVMQALCGTFGVELIGAVGLRNADFLASDPYAVVLVNTAPRQNCSWRSRVIDNTLNPVWRELHEFQLNWPNNELSEAVEVKIEVWDNDDLNADDFLGEVSFPLPTGNGENLIDLELKDNRLKGTNEAKGRLRARVYFRDQFAQATEDDRDAPLEEVQASFAEFFGNWEVDEQLARVMAAPLIYFHLSDRRVFKSQLSDAWRRVTFDLMSATGRGGKGRGQCYLNMTAALWFAMAVAACLRALIKGIVGAAVGGFLGGALAPDLANILQRFYCHRLPEPASAEEFDLSVHSPSTSSAISVTAILISMGIVTVCVGFTTEDQISIETVIGAGTVLVTRFVFVPMWEALFLTFVLRVSKRSRMFDSKLRRNPSIVTASGALLKGLPLQNLVPIGS